jgi:hypothetical protein
MRSFLLMYLIGNLQTKRILDFTKIRIDEHDFNIRVVYGVKILSNAGCCLIGLKSTSHNDNLFGF